MENRPIILVIDFANIIFSGFYAKDDDTNNVNAVIVFFKRLRSLKQMFDPKYIIFAEDMGRNNTFRRKMYPPYKAQRKPMDPVISKQMGIIRALVKELGFAHIGNELYEADDIIGMTSRWGIDNGYDTVIASSDRDMYQLISENVYVSSPKNSDLITLDTMQMEYQLTPEQWIDLKILQGDGSDNIPGIRGIGHNTALSLMQQFGSIDNIYNNLDMIKPGFRNKLIAGKSDIPLMRDLVTILTDYTLIDLKEEKLRRYMPIYENVESLLYEYKLMPSLGSVMEYSIYPQEDEKMEVFSL